MKTMTNEALVNQINTELDRLGASSTTDVAGLDCDEVVDGAATFSDSTEVFTCDAEKALAALRAAAPIETVSGEPSGFEAAWAALTKLVRPQDRYFAAEDDE